MDNHLTDHLNEVDNLITFLEQYKKTIKNNVKKFQKNNLSENFYINNIAIENLKDGLLEILSGKDIIYNSSLKNKIDELNTVNKNIKEIMPILIYYFISKNTFNFDQEVLEAL